MKEQLKVISIQVGSLSTNCYLVYDPNSKDCLIIDPGDEPSKIIKAIDKERLHPKIVINTHGHPDHTAANTEIKDKYNIPVYIHEKDAPYLTEEASRIMQMLGYKSTNAKPDKQLREGDEISLGKIVFKVYHIPGHTQGGIALYGDGKVFTGDSLFAGDIGRSDLYGGSEEELIAAIRSKLLTLPDETIVYPGHGMTSTIAEEKKSNPYV